MFFVQFYISYFILSTIYFGLLFFIVSHSFWYIYQFGSTLTLLQHQLLLSLQILCIIGTGLICFEEYGYWKNLPTHDVIIIAVIGYLFILLNLMVVSIIDTTNDWMEVLFLLIGGVMNLISGLIMIYDCIYCMENEIKISGHAIYPLMIICTLNSILMFVDLARLYIFIYNV